MCAWTLREEGLDVSTTRCMSLRGVPLVANVYGCLCVTMGKTVEEKLHKKGSFEKILYSILQVKKGPKLLRTLNSNIRALLLNVLYHSVIKPTNHLLFL